MPVINKLSDAKAYLSEYQVVIFDLDDTLYSEKDYVRSGYKELALHNESIDRMEQKLWTAFEHGKRSIDYVLHQEGVYSRDKALACLQIYRNHKPSISLYKDARDLLVYLKKCNVRLGLITDGRPEGQWAKINALGIKPYFEKIIITDELGGVEFRKPHTKAFEILQSFFGTPYSQMVYVGDNPSKDFIAPEKLGMGFVYFNNPDGLYSDKGR